VATSTLWFMLLFVATGFLLVGLSLPLVWRWVKPNHFYGFRTPKSMSSERIWYESNAYAGRAMFWAGSVFIVASVVLHFVIPTNIVAYNVACTAVLSVSLLIAVLMSLRHLQFL
jgi:uncharacterized membrane protein